MKSPALIPAVVMAMLVAFGCSKPSDPAELVGAPAPPYEAVNLAGEPVSLASLRGEVVILNVWATWCAPCRQEIPYLATLQAADGPKGLRVVGVSVDREADHGKVADLAPKLGISYTVWLDPNERIGGLLRSPAVPATMLVDRAGIVRWKHTGVLREATPGFRDALNAALAAGSMN